MSKKGIEYKASLSGEQVLKHLESLIKSLSDGRVCLQVGQDHVVMDLDLSQAMDMQLEGSQKKNRNKLSLELSWLNSVPAIEPGPEMLISSEPPPEPQPEAEPKEEAGASPEAAKQPEPDPKPKPETESGPAAKSEPAAKPESAEVKSKTTARAKPKQTAKQTAKKAPANKAPAKKAAAKPKTAARPKRRTAKG